MLEQYYVRPVTLDRIRGSWIASPIEQYVASLTTQRYARSSVSRRIPLLMAFGEFAKSQGATEFAHLPDHVESFARKWAAEHGRPKISVRSRKRIQDFARNSVRQMLRLSIPGYIGRGRPHRPDNPFERQAPRFLAYLVEEKGLRQRSIAQYQFHLRQFAAHLERVGISDLAQLSPVDGGLSVYQ